MNLRQVLFRDYRRRNIVFTSLILVLSILAWTPSSSFISGVLLLASLHLYSRVIFPSEHAFRWASLLWITLTIGGALPNIKASLHALSTTATSVGALLCLSSVSALLVLGAFYVDTRTCTRLNTSWAQISLFPAVWATMWCAVAHLSPLGHLSTWSQVGGTGDAYEWMVPLLGPASRDWVAAAWAVVVSDAIGAWYIGREEQSSTLIDHTHESLTQDQPRVTPRLSRANSSLLLGILLTALTLPSFVFSELPLTDTSLSTTPLGLACALPSFRRYKHHVLTLDDYIDETKKLSAAKIILWPESAVSFNSEAARDEGLDKIRKVLQNGIYVGVSFEETFEDPNDQTGWTGSKRAVLALISNASTSPHLVYYKRHLVPITESFSLSPSHTPPDMYTINLPKSGKDVNNSDWGTPPNYTRPIPVTASICLDFAHTSLFTDLESRPALILAPARTWERTIGYTMWKQAAQRAEELGTMVLWCDGGAGGVSGIAGRGYREVTHVGSGSWVRNIGLEYPFNDRRTLYAYFGDLTISLFWISVIGFSIGSPFSGGSGVLQKGARSVRNVLKQWRGQKRDQPELERGEPPNLVDL